MNESPQVAEALARLNALPSGTPLTPAAVENIRLWLTKPAYAAYVAEIGWHLSKGMYKELDDAFWTVIPFGTGGRRGRMYPIGSNAINDRTIGESAQGLAAYIRRQVPGEHSCAIAYDTRHRSRHFAELCARVMVANGFRVYLLDEYRSTPELSFLVRHRRCTCGIMVTASHNPPSDNAVKVYWSNGAQVLPPHDDGIIAEVMQVGEIPLVDFEGARQSGKVIIDTAATDAAYLEAVAAQGCEGPRDLSILYSPLHGVGEFSVCAALRRDGFQQVEVFELHREPSGDFPNVPGHVSNPENPAVFDAMVERARESGGELALATDPDCDRMGCSAPRTLDPRGEWGSFTGNQLGAMLCDYVLERRRGGLTKDHYIVTTLVTTQMLSRIAAHYGVRCLGDHLVGFKWICGRMDEEGPDKFLFGTEESHGFLVGQYARDKDGAVACMLMAELAARQKAAGRSLHEYLDSLYWQHGYHAEHLVNVKMEGSEGMAKMTALMQRLRSAPPRTLGGLDVAQLRDYSTNRRRDLRRGVDERLDGPTGDLVILDLAADGNYVAVRPSGTEPKAKFYLFSYCPAEQLHDLDAVRRDMDQRLRGIEADLRAFAGV